MTDKESFVAPFEALDPNLGHMLRAYLEEEEPVSDGFDTWDELKDAIDGEFEGFL